MFKLLLLLCISCFPYVTILSPPQDSIVDTIRLGDTLHWTIKSNLPEDRVTFEGTSVDSIGYCEMVSPFPCGENGVKRCWVRLSDEDPPEFYPNVRVAIKRPLHKGLVYIAVDQSIDIPWEGFIEPYVNYRMYYYDDGTVHNQVQAPKLQAHSHKVEWFNLRGQRIAVPTMTGVYFQRVGNVVRRIAIIK